MSRTNFCKSPRQSTTPATNKCVLTLLAERLHLCTAVFDHAVFVAALWWLRWVCLVLGRGSRGNGCICFVSRLIRRTVVSWGRPACKCLNTTQWGIPLCFLDLHLNTDTHDRNGPGVPNCIVPDCGFHPRKPSPDGNPRPLGFEAKTQHQSLQPLQTDRLASNC